MAVCLAGLLCPIMAVKAQWVTFDPSNFAQSIVNTTRNVVQTTTTAENMVKNFQETVKIYDQKNGLLYLAGILNQIVDRFQW